MRGKSVLITGASAGIGAEFARQYAELGADLILTARREERLRALADHLSSVYGSSVEILAEDLADPHASQRLIDWMRQLGLHADVLINNAGYGLPGTFLNTKWEDQRDFLQVMLTAPAELCHKLLPGMVERGWGRIINVASLAGFTPGSRGHTLYGPVKAAMIRMSESLHAEAEGTGVQVTALCPGLTYSEFHDVNGQRDRLNGVPRFMWQSTEAVVSSAIRANEKNRPVVVTGGVNKALAVATQMLPDPISRGLMKAQSRRFRSADL